MDIMEMELEKTNPNKIAFCSFTKKAVNEAIDRATSRFNLSASDLPYFKTLHSLGYLLLGLKKATVMQQSDYKLIGEHLGLKFNARKDISDLTYGGNPGDKYTFIMGFARARNIPYRLLWEDIDKECLNWQEFQRFVSTVNQYKREHQKFDFQDMIDMYNKDSNLDVLILDEAQDLSTSQWLFVEKVFRNTKRIYIAGDDDQAIYQWSGADVEHFIHKKGQIEQLKQSWRVPNKVFNAAQGIVNRISNRTPKLYQPKDEQGEVVYWNDVDHIDMSSGTWMLLGRNLHYLSELQRIIYEKGYMFTIKGKLGISYDHVKAISAWERWRKDGPLSIEEERAISELTGTDIESWDKSQIWHKALVNIPIELREYYISLLRNGESLTKPPRIHINTIHGVKGGEADNVVLLSDMTTATWEGQSMNKDAEHRVWYVGATRCKNSLHIIRPRGRFYYEI
jgi:DNA helicase-2/ATP-dependent DNA helicase PcrA